MIIVEDPRDQWQSGSGDWVALPYQVYLELLITALANDVSRLSKTPASPAPLQSQVDDAQGLDTCALLDLPWQP